jgi:hypothetical protein
MKKKSVSFFLVVILLVSLTPVSASAMSGSDAADWLQAPFWDLVAYGNEFAGATIRNWWDAGPAAFWTGLTGGESQAEQDYINNVNDLKGSTVVGSGGYYIPLVGNASSSYGYMKEAYPEYSLVVLQMSKYFSETSYYNDVQYALSAPAGLSVPYSGYVTLYCQVFADNGSGVDVLASVRVGDAQAVYQHSPRSGSPVINPRVSCTAGLVLVPQLTMTVLGQYNDLVGIEYRAAIYYEPYGFNLNTYTEDIGGADARVGNIPLNYAVTSGNETTIHENTIIFNEKTGKAYNPVTGDTRDVTDWSYDYATREYQLAYDTGDTAIVAYGNANVSIREGDVTYNVYYVIPNDNGGTTPTNPPATNPPAPTNPLVGDVGSDSVSVDGNNNTGGIFKWFGNINITIGDIIDNIFGGGSGDGSGDGGEESGGGLFDWLFGGIKKIFDILFGGIYKLLEATITPIIDFLVNALEMVFEKLTVVMESISGIFTRIPELFSGYGTLLGSFFSFLPPEMQILFDILTIGVLGMVIVAIIKRFI